MQRSWRVGWWSGAGWTVTMRWWRVYWYLALGLSFRLVSPVVCSSGAAVMAMRWQLSPRLPMMDNNRSADDPGYAGRRKRCNDGNVGHSTIDGRKIR